MAKEYIKKRINTTDIVKRNSKTFIKEVNSFNNRLKKAYEKKLISKNTYATLIIDKDKRDFYKGNIYTKKQFKEFVNNLKSANSKTLKAGRKGIGINDLRTTIYERKLYRQQFKYLQDYDEIYDVNYTDIAVNVNRKNKETVFKILQRAKYITENKSIRFRINMKKAVDKIFGTNKRTKLIKEKIDKLTDKQLNEMLDNNPNIKIEMVYDDNINIDTRIEVLERGLDEEMELKKARKKGKKIRKKHAKIEEYYNPTPEEIEMLRKS